MALCIDPKLFEECGKVSAHADEIRDAEILELQRRVKELEHRVKDLEARPIFIPCCPPSPPYPPSYPPLQPFGPWQVPYRPSTGPDWTYRPTIYSAGTR